MASVAKQDPVDVEIGERLHQWMWRNRIAQNGMAERIGMSGPSLGRKLRGESAWSAGELTRAAAALGVPVGWFFGEADDVRPKGLEPLTFWFGVWVRRLGICRLRESRASRGRMPHLSAPVRLHTDDLELAA
jgi:transcriptional regulator with XRE-family HTH domain